MKLPRLMPTWLRNILTEDDNETFNPEAMFAAGGILLVTGLAIHSVVVNKEPFLANALGLGTSYSSLVLAYGGARKLARPKTAAAPEPGQ